MDSVDSTLLIDELDSCGSRAVVSEMLRLLRVGSTPGVKTVRNGRLFSAFSFKVISARNLPSDWALESRAIVVPMLPTVDELEPLTGEAMARIAEEFRRGC